MNYNYENINTASAAASSTNYDNNLFTTFKIINAPNNIPSLQLKIEPYKNIGHLTVSDIINSVVTRYKSLGLKENYPIENITILIEGKPYNNSSKNTQVTLNGRLSKIEIMFPKEIDKKYLLTKVEATEETTLNGKPKSSWWPWG